MTFSAAMLLLIGLTTIVVIGAFRALAAATRTTERIRFDTFEESATALETSIGALRERTAAFSDDLSGRSCST